MKIDQKTEIKEEIIPKKSEDVIDSENRYVVLAETNGGELETWLYFIKLNGNEDSLKYLNDQLDKIDMYIIDDISTFDLDMEHTVSEKTAKEMTKIEINSFMYHRKFDGVLQLINLNLRKKDENDDMLEKLNDVLGLGQIEDYISNEDVSEDDLESESDEVSSDDDPLVPLPDKNTEIKSHKKKKKRKH